MASERPCQSADERPDISDDHLNWTPRKRPCPAAMPVNAAVRTCSRQAASSSWRGRRTSWPAWRL